MAHSKTEHIGRIAVKDELKLVSDGYVSCVRFRIAVDRDYKTRDGQVITDFFNCVAYLELAEHIVEHFEKGDTVFVIGRNRNVEWEAEDGKHTRDEIEIEKCIFIHRKKRQ